MIPGNRAALGGGWVAFGLGPIVLYRRRARGDAEVPGNTKAAASPMTPIAARVIIARPYVRLSVEVTPATRMVPERAAPREEPSFDTLRQDPRSHPPGPR